MRKYFLIFFLFTISALAVKAQKADSLARGVTEKKLQARRDSAKANPIVPKIKERIYHPDSNHSPHKAIIRSLMIPGWGQLYNHQWWLLPPIYLGLGDLARAFITNNNSYKSLLVVAKLRESGVAPATTDKNYALYQNYAQYSATTIDDAVSGYKRNSEISVFGFVAVWGVQMIQAYIDAKFQHSYSMDNDFSVKVSPLIGQPAVMGSNVNASYITGLKLTFTLK